jgi:Protein of unknown function (DUF2550)
MGELIAPLLLIACLIVLFGLVLGIFVLRHLILGRRPGSFDCSLRQDLTRSAGGWMLGVARYHVDRLEWFRIFSFTPRPGRVLERSLLVVRDWYAPPETDIDTLMPESVIVRCHYQQEEIEFAMTREDYTGFATWLESAPPGLPPLAP